MIIGLDTIGNQIIESALPSAENIYSAELKNVIVDDFYISKDGVLTDKTEPIWTIDTYLLAKFEDGSLEAGNVINNNLEINNWRVRRRPINSIIYKELATIPISTEGNFYYLDYTGRSGVIYEYEITPMAGDIEGTPTTITVKCEFDYWWISDDTQSYPLYANIEISDITTNIQRHIYEGFDIFPTISYGNQKYQSGTITAMLFDGNLQASKEYRDLVEAFINNKKIKYLKSPKGDIWVVDTHSSKKKLETSYEDDICTITFDWCEVASNDNL